MADEAGVEVMESDDVQYARWRDLPLGLLAMAVWLVAMALYMLVVPVVAVVHALANAVDRFAEDALKDEE